MNKNDILHKIYKALSLTLDDMVKIYELEKHEITKEHIESLFKKEEDEGYVSCTYEELGLFLDGLVVFKRGPSPKKSNSSEVVELTNNLIIKKLRIALELKEPEIEIVFSLGEAELTKQQLSSLFRKDTHKNFRLCSDELLIAFLDGLDEFYYDGEEV